MKDFQTAFRLSLPVLGAYWFLGITYGLLASSLGYSVYVPVAMAMVIYSGSVEFIALTMLAGAFNPTAAFVMSLMVGARHLFYGISMLDIFRGAGWRKPLLIYWMSDETFAINYSQGGSFRQQLWVSVLDFLYWISGGVAGYVIGSVLSPDLMSHLEGLDFVVTAMFTAIFMDDFMRHPRSHSSAWIGICAAVLCLMVFGSQRFLIPTMLCILTLLYIKYKHSSTVHGQYPPQHQAK